MITAEIIQNIPGINTAQVVYQSGDLHKVAKHTLPPEHCDADSLVFVSEPAQLDAALKAQAAIIIALHKLPLPSTASSTLFQAKSIPLAMALVLPVFDGKMNRFNQENKIHPQSFIHPTAHIGKGVTIGPFVSIGENVHIGDSATIGANCVIENEARIGDHTLLHPLVFVGAQCTVGSYCELHPHTTIGSDGFSFTKTQTGEQKKIPQLGKVVIEDHVEMGANCAVDRAAFLETRIGRGTKFDNFCHIAHNVHLGEHSVFAAGFRVAGSTKVGSHLMVGGDVSVTDHIEICDQVVLAGRSGVTNNIEKPGAYGGFPLEPLRDNMRTMASIAHLRTLRKQVHQILKHLNLSSED